MWNISNGSIFTLLSGWFDCARLLLNEYKADPDLKNKENLTALDVIYYPN